MAAVAGNMRGRFDLDESLSKCPAVSFVCFIDIQIFISSPYMRTLERSDENRRSRFSSDSAAESRSEDAGTADGP
jgi:hypothetical protein